MDGQDQPRIYTIRDHTLEVLMHPDVLELHAVRVVHTPQGDERQLHLKVRVRCGQEELVLDVLVDTDAQVSLVWRGLFKEESLQPSRRPVHLKVANGEIMRGGGHEATFSMEFWEHERLNRPALAKRSTLSGNFYVANITDWDMIMGYDFMVGNAIGALPHRATLDREDDYCLTWLSTDYACGSSQWNAEEEDRIAQAVQAVGAKSRADRGVQLTEYGMAPQVYARMIQTLGAEAPGTEVFASRDAPMLRKCRMHWHPGDSAWHRHWGLKELVEGVKILRSAMEIPMGGPAEAPYVPPRVDPGALPFVPMFSESIMLGEHTAPAGSMREEHATRDLRSLTVQMSHDAQDPPIATTAHAVYAED